MYKTSSRYLAVVLLTGLTLTTPADARVIRKKERKVTQTFSDQKGDIKLNVKTVSKPGILKEYQPIHFTFTNTGNEKFLFKAEDIGLELITKKELKDIGNKRYNILPFTAIFSAQVFTVGQLIAQTLIAPKLAIALPIIGIGSLATTALEQFRIKKLNKKELALFNMMKQGIEVEPYSIRKVTLHVKRENIKPKFDIKLINSFSRNAVRFNIDFTPQTKPPKGSFDIKMGKVPVISKKNK